MKREDDNNVVAHHARTTPSDTCATKQDQGKKRQRGLLMMHIANGNYKEVDEDQDKREAQWKNMMVERIFSCTIKNTTKKQKT